MSNATSKQVWRHIDIFKTTKQNTNKTPNINITLSWYLQNIKFLVEYRLEDSSYFVLCSCLSTVVGYASFPTFVFTGATILLQGIGAKIFLLQLQATHQSDLVDAIHFTNPPMKSPSLGPLSLYRRPQWPSRLYIDSCSNWSHAMHASKPREEEGKNRLSLYSSEYANNRFSVHFDLWAALVGFKLGNPGSIARNLHPN